MSAAARHTTAKAKRFRVLVLFTTPYPAGVTAPAEWLDREGAGKWIDEKGLSPLVADEDFAGGLLLRTRATDPEAAVATAGDIVDALIARAAVGTRHQLIALRYALVSGTRDRRVELRRRRRVEVRAVERQDRLADDLYAMVRSPVDASLQLLSPLDTGTAEVAVGGGWSAIESLLTAPGDAGGNVMAADRLATLVACAWPRAELTTLAARRIAALDDDLSVELRAAPSNRARAERIAEVIEAGVWLRLTAPADMAAIRRVEKLIASPAEALRDVERYAIEAFRRLYRQRNLVLHGGRTSAVALQPTLRTVAPLVGAGIDRIVHAHFETGAEPLDLAARARLELDRAGSRDAPAVTRLLEPM